MCLTGFKHIMKLNHILLSESDETGLSHHDMPSKIELLQMQQAVIDRINEKYDVVIVAPNQVQIKFGGGTFGTIFVIKGSKVVKANLSVISDIEYVTHAELFRLLNAYKR